MSGFRVRSTHEVDYNDAVLPLSHQPHLSADCVFNAWIEDDVAVFATPAIAATFVEEWFPHGGWVIEPAIGAARPPLHVTYIALLAEADGAS